MAEFTEDAEERASQAIDEGTVLGIVLGTARVSKEFPGHGMFGGTVVRWTGHYFSVTYDDGDGACVLARRRRSVVHRIRDASNRRRTVVSDDSCFRAASLRSRPADACVALVCSRADCSAHPTARGALRSDHPVADMAR